MADKEFHWISSHFHLDFVFTIHIFKDLQCCRIINRHCGNSKANADIILPQDLL